MARLLVLLQIHVATATMRQLQHRQHSHSRHLHRAAVPPLADAVATDISDAAFDSAPEDVHPVQEADELRLEREAIFNSVHSVASGMDTGVSLHHLLTKQKVRVSKEEQKIGHLRKQAEGIRKAHGAAARRLQSVMMERIALSERRLEKKRASVAKRKQEVRHWEEMRTNASAKTAKAAEERSGQEKRLERARAEVQNAMKLEEETKHNFSVVEAHAAHEAQALDLADAKLSVAQTQMAHEIQEQETMEASLSKARATLSKEELQFDEELARTEDKLEKNINRVEVKKEQAERELFATKDEFLAWQAAQNEKAREVAAMKSNYETRQKALNDNDDLRGELLRSSAAADDAGVQEDWAWGL